VLASRSPRRTEILKLAGIPHRVYPSSVEEKQMDGLPADIVVHWAQKKAMNVASVFPDSPVLGHNGISGQCSPWQTIGR